MNNRRRGIIIRGPLGLAALLAFFGLFALFAGGWSTLAGIGLIVLSIMVAIVAKGQDDL